MTPANARRYGGKYRSQIGLIIGLTGQHIIENKALLSYGISAFCSTCAASHLPAPPATCTSGTTDYGDGCLAGATGFVDRVIACIQASAQQNSELIFIPIMTDIQKLVSESLPPNSNVTFPRTLTEPIDSIHVGNFNDFILDYFSHEDGNTLLSPGLVNRIARVTEKLITWTSNPTSITIPDSMKQLLCCKESWDCLNKYICECAGEVSTDCTTYSADCP